MRLLFIFIYIYAAACTSRVAKHDVNEGEIDVPWEEQSPALTDSNPAAPKLHTSTYILTWQGKRIGQAREVFHRSTSGVRIIRSEEIRITRSGVPVESETEIIIHATPQLHATKVELRARLGAVTRTGQALRADNGQWVIALEGEKVRKEDAAAVPLELVPYIVAQSDSTSYRSKVLLPGFGFAVTEMELTQEGQSGRAVLHTVWGDIETRLQMALDGTLLRANTGSTGSVLVAPTKLARTFTPPELPGTSFIPVQGKYSETASMLVLNNALRQPPPALREQSIRLQKNGWRIAFTKEQAMVSRRVVALTREVDQLLNDAQDAPGASAKAALELGRGDCTAHATLFVDMARAQGMEAKLITGYRIDGQKLVRHRWVHVKQDSQWIQVDPTFGQAPVQPGQYLALAIHDVSTAQIALVDEAVFRGLATTKARWVPQAR